jgi:hypothetical protein
MIARQTLIGWSWRVPVCMLVLIIGQALGVALVSFLGLRLPTTPGSVEGGAQSLMIFPWAFVLTLAMAVIAVGLAGRWWERWAILAAFIYVIYGVSNAIETIIFTTLGGQLGSVVLHLPPSILGGLAVSLLFAAPSAEDFRERAAEFFSGWKPQKLVARLMLAVVAFPFFYLLFGMIVAPIVTPYYERLDFLVIPPAQTILKVIILRSVLLLLASLPVIIAWRESRGRLIIALGTGHFVAVGLAGLILAPFFPPVLRWTHGVEILADSVCYAAALAWLLFPRPRRGGAEQPMLRERVA